ncbi:MAG: hypothetical protein ABL959_15805, partial [Pyrinomonadaceae bacterium]
MANEFDELIGAVNKGTRLISLSGLTSIAAKAKVLMRLRAETGKRFAVVADTNYDIDLWADDLEFFAATDMGEEFRPLTLPSFDTDPYSGVSPHAETQERRALALWQIAKGESDILVMSGRSLIQRTASVDEIASLGCELVRDADSPPEDVVSRLIAGGYVREDPIFGPGQFSIRGGIIDIWSPDAETPVRVEFFGDTVDSIRSFDADTQLSVEQLKSVAIAPMREFATTPQDLKDWAFFANERFGQPKFARTLRDRTDFAKEGETFSGWEFLMPMVKPLTGSIFDHLTDYVFVIDEPATIEHSLTNLYERLVTTHAAITDAGDVGLDIEELFLDPEMLRSKLDGVARIEARSLGRTSAATDEEFQVSEGSSATLFLFPTAEKSTELEIQSRSTRKFHGDIPAFVAEFEKDDQIVVQTSGMAERLAEILREYDKYVPQDTIRVGMLSSGFELPLERLRIFTESDIFGETSNESTPKSGRKATPGARKSKLGAFIS